MNLSEFWQVSANVITVFGLPLAIYTFILEQRKERDNEDEEVYQLLSDAYIDFLKLVLEHPNLKLRTQTATPNLTDEQHCRNCSKVKTETSPPTLHEFGIRKSRAIELRAENDCHLSHRERTSTL